MAYYLVSAAPRAGRMPYSGDRACMTGNRHINLPHFKVSIHGELKYGM